MNNLVKQAIESINNYIGIQIETKNYSYMFWRAYDCFENVAIVKQVSYCKIDLNIGKEYTIFGLVEIDDIIEGLMDSDLFRSYNEIKIEKIN